MKVTILPRWGFLRTLLSRVLRAGLIAKPVLYALLGWGFVREKELWAALRELGISVRPRRSRFSPAASKMTVEALLVSLQSGAWKLA